jgi:hypothetical protein
MCAGVLHGHKAPGVKEASIRVVRGKGGFLVSTMAPHTSVAVIQVRPPECFTNIFITTPIVSALKNYYG